VPFVVLTIREFLVFCNRKRIKEKNCIYFARIPSYFCHVIRSKWHIILSYLFAVSRQISVCKSISDMHKYISTPLRPVYL
jgi:hypothetical protein